MSMTKNQLTYWANQEQIKANRAREAETERYNRAQEALKKRDLDTQWAEHRSKNLERIGKLIAQTSNMVTGAAQALGSIL